MNWDMVTIILQVAACLFVVYLGYRIVVRTFAEYARNSYLLELIGLELELIQLHRDHVISDDEFSSLSNVLSDSKGSSDQVSFGWIAFRIVENECLINYVLSLRHVDQSKLSGVQGEWLRQSAWLAVANTILPSVFKITYALLFAAMTGLIFGRDKNIKFANMPMIAAESVALQQILLHAGAKS